MLSSLLWIFQKLLTQSGILPSSLKSSLWVFHSDLSNRYNLISQITVQKYTYVILIVILSVFIKVFHKIQFWTSPFLCLLIISLSFFLHLVNSLSMLTILLFGPLPEMLNMQLSLSKLPSTDWWNGPLNGIYLSTL